MKLGIKKTVATIWRNKVLFLCVLLFFFSAVLKVYLPTTVLPEVFILGLFVYGAINPIKKTDALMPGSALPVWILFLLYFVLASLATHWGDDGSGFFNENYRLLTFLLITILLGSSKINFLAVAKFCLWCCRFHVFFTLFELFYLTFVSLGDFYGVPLVGAAMPELDADGGYLRENDNLISYGFRPFGLMLQPQKTGFVFVIGAVLEYVIAWVENRKPSVLWNGAFVAISILQGAKTAFLILFVIEAAVFFNYYPSRKNTFGKIMFYVSIAIVSLYIIIHNVALSTIGNDTNARVMDDVTGFLSYGVFNVLFGIGTPVNKDMLAHGFSCECYLVRIFCNWGGILTMLLFYYLARFFLPHDRKVAYVIVIAFFGMVYHYCVINVYFIALAFSSVICLALYNEKKCVNNIYIRSHSLSSGNSKSSL